MARLRRGRLRWVIAAGVVIALVAAAVVAWPYAQRYTGSAPPAPSEPDLDQELGPIDFLTLELPVQQHLHRRAAAGRTLPAAPRPAWAADTRREPPAPLPRTVR